MAHTRTELDAMTAKALRPIAADLGITGVSRMRKDEIIAAVLSAETQTPERWVNIEKPTQSWQGLVVEQTDTEITLDEWTGWHLGDNRPTYAQHGETVTITIDADTKIATDDDDEEAANEALVAGVPAELCAHGIDATRSCAICKANARELARLAADIEDAHAEALRAHVAIVPSPQDLPEIPEPGPGVVSIELSDGPVLIEPGEIEKRMPSEKYFARRTRRGTETVVVERTHAGRVDYRIIDPRTGRRSAPYNMRAAKFVQDYVKVPS